MGASAVKMRLQIMETGWEHGQSRAGIGGEWREVGVMK